jgi:hypothetical protein
MTILLSSMEQTIKLKVNNVKWPLCFLKIQLIS